MTPLGVVLGAYQKSVVFNEFIKVSFSPGVPIEIRKWFLSRGWYFEISRTRTPFSASLSNNSGARVGVLIITKICCGWDNARKELPFGDLDDRINQLRGFCLDGDSLTI